MPITKLHLSRDHVYYKYDGKDVVVTHEWTDVNGVMSIEGHTVDSRIPFCCSKQIFMDAAEVALQPKT
jgi:hypothetical protein